MKKNCFAIGLFLFVLFGTSSQIFASSITVSNGGFENPSLANYAATINNIPGWSGGAGFGVWDPHDTAAFPANVPEGENVAYNNRTYITQTVTHDVILGMTYVLKVEVGDSLSADFPGYTVELLAGGNIVGSENSLVPTDGTFLTSTVSWTADDHVGESLGIRLTSAGGSTYFDDVRLDAVPIPGAVWLLGSGLIGLVAVRRKFKK